MNGKTYFFSSGGWALLIFYNWTEGDLEELKRYFYWPSSTVRLDEISKAFVGLTI